MIVGAGHRIVGQQHGELVEGCNLGGPGPRQLFRDPLQRLFRQHPADRPDDPLAVVGRRLGVDLQRLEPRHGGNLADLVADRNPEYLPCIRGRVGRDQQHPLARIGQTSRRGAGQRGLADATLAGEEDELRQIVQHGISFRRLLQAGVASLLDRASRRRQPQQAASVSGGRVAMASIRVRNGARAAGFSE